MAKVSAVVLFLLLSVSHRSVKVFPNITLTRRFPMMPARLIFLDLLQPNLPLLPLLTSGPKPTPPTERRKLTLAPRSAAPASSDSPASSAAPSSTTSASIFGAAKPIDSASREKAVEARLAEREAERKKAAEEERAKEAEKIKAEADARAKAINDAREKARLEVEGSAGGARRQSGPGQQNPGQGQGRRGPPARVNSHGNNANGNANGPAGAPTSPRGNNQGQAGGRKGSNSQGRSGGVVGEDGFEGVASSRSAKPTQQATTQKKDAPVRQGFSFAAAMKGVGAAIGLVEGDDEEEEEKEEKDEVKKANGGEGEKKVEEVTKKVEDVSV